MAIPAQLKMIPPRDLMQTSFNYIHLGPGGVPYFGLYVKRLEHGQDLPPCVHSNPAGETKHNQICLVWILLTKHGFYIHQSGSSPE